MIKFVGNTKRWQRISSVVVMLALLFSQWPGPTYPVNAGTPAASAFSPTELPHVDVSSLVEVVDPQPQLELFVNDDLASASIRAESIQAWQGISGANPWVWILCKFSDYPDEPVSLSYVETMSNTLDAYFREVSYNKANITGSDVVGWYSLGHTYDYYLTGSGGTFNLSAAAQDCITAADADVYFPDFYGLNLMFNARPSASYAAITTYLNMTLDGEQRWWPSVFIGDDTIPPAGYFNLALNAHEMYHGFGLGHSALRDENWAVIGGNQWDPVGIGACMFGDCNPHHIPAPQKDELGWIDAGKIYTATLASQTITLEALSLPQTDNYLMAKIPLENDHFYTLEARRPAGADGKVPGPAVIIHEVDLSPPCMPGCNGYIRLIPVPGLADPAGAGAMWTVGRIFIDTTRGVTVTVVASTTTGFQVQIETRPAVHTLLYVDKDATGANNGASWTDAFTDLQAALSVASPTGFDTVEIWVAEGAYKPTGGSDRTLSFGLKNNVSVYGGFAGTETERSQRDVAAHPTILSGDLLGNDNANVDPDEPTRADNSYHVVTGVDGAAMSVLDGFTITGGNANGAATEDWSKGGGMFHIDAGTILRNLTFARNTALYGGGLYNSGALTLDNAAFLNNSAAPTGGGMCNVSRDSIHLTHVVFIGNVASGSGGGLYLSLGTATLINAVFSGNTASLSGGGVHNAATLLTLINATFSANTAIVYSNSVGGGLRNASGRTAAITNTIFWNNKATYWQYTNTEAQIANAGTVDVTYSLVQGGVYTGTGNISSDPLFVDADGADNVAGTEDDNLRLRRISPAIDAGDNDAVPAGVTTDVDGNPRFIEHPQANTGHGTPPLVDMGAYEATIPGNQAPTMPGNPTPANGATNVVTTTTLSWSGGDPDGDPVTYTVAFGTNSPPPVVGAVTTLSYDPGTLVTSTTYYWRITASDGLSTTVGPLWSFTTRSGETFHIYLPLVLRNHRTPAANERLIVFEAFMSIDCGFSQNAAGVIESQLIPEYAGWPVLFLEHDVLLNYTDPRQSRWWDGYQVGGMVGYPLAMVDSGDQVAERFTSGADFYNLYKSMVDAALAVPESQAKVQATAVRVEDLVTFTVDVTNQGSVTLGPANKATIWVLVYEQSDNGPVSGGWTSRYVRAKTSQAISANLSPGAGAQYVLTVDDLSGVDWSKMHAVVIVDYKPNPSVRPYDTYEAVTVDIP